MKDRLACPRRRLVRLFPLWLFVVLAGIGRGAGACLGFLRHAGGFRLQAIDAGAGFLRRHAVFGGDKLRKAIAAGDPRMMEWLQNKTIVQTVRDPDVDNLMSALIPLAAKIIRGTI